MLAVSRRESIVGEQVRLCFEQHLRDFGLLAAELVGNEAQLGAGCGLVRLCEDGAQELNDHAGPRLGHLGIHVAQEMYVAPLPARPLERAGEGGDQALVIVGYHQLDAAQPTPHQRAQELGPERLRFAQPDFQAQHLSVAILVDAVGHHDRTAHHAAVLAHLQVRRIQPEVRVGHLQRPFTEGGNLVVERLAHPADLGLRTVLHAQGQQQVLDLAGAHALDVCLLDDGQQRSLGTLARLQEAGEVAALAQLRNEQLDAAEPGVEAALPVAVAARLALRILFVEAGAGQSGHLYFHDLGKGAGERVCQKIEAVAAQDLAQSLVVRHAGRGHPCGSFPSVAFRKNHGDGFFSKQPFARTYTTLRDTTVESDANYESWQLTDNFGTRIVSIPGGGLAIWLPSIPGSD
ncbi:hypothetical protein D3C72_820670 [compost metagenome]